MVPITLVFKYAFCDSRPELTAVALRVTARINSVVPPECVENLAPWVNPILIVTVRISVESPLIVIVRMPRAVTILFSTLRIIIVIRFMMPKAFKPNRFIWLFFFKLLTVVAYHIVEVPLWVWQLLRLWI